MRILYRGTPSKDYIQQGTCSQCRTKIEFTRSEGKLVFDQREGDYYEHSCPVCSNTIYSQASTGKEPK